MAELKKEIKAEPLPKTQKKPKRWNIGFQAGLGFQYDILNNRAGIGPYLGVGVSYGFGF